MGESVSTVLTDLSHDSLVCANESNQENIYRLLATVPNADCYDGPDMLRVCTGVPHFLANVVLRARMDRGALHASLADTLAVFRSRSLPMTWMLGESTRPIDLPTHLESHGLVFMGSMPAMAIDLNLLPEAVPDPPSGVSICEAICGQSRTEWAEVCAVGSGVPLEVMRLFDEMVQPMAPDGSARLRRFIAYLDGKPVGTSLGYVDGSVVGIYCVCVLKEAQRRGIGAAIAAAPLLCARKQGYRVGILQASKMGESIYRRMGFQDYGRFTMYRDGS